MTKRIIALALVAVFACLALVSCNNETPATTPAGTTAAPATKPAGTTSAPATTPAGTTVAPATTPATPATTPDPTDPVVTPDPTDTVVTPDVTPTPTEPAVYDMFARFGGIEKIFAEGSFYGTAFETWPFADNGSWCARAFFQSCVVIGANDGDFTQNLGTDDYEYTWKFFYHDAEVYPESDADIKGPYTAPTETFYKFDNGNVIYRLQVGSAPEGDMCEELEVGKTYMFIVALYKGDTCVGFTYISQLWDARYDAYHELYKDFWTQHNRADGYGTGMQTVTSADEQKATELGFNEKGEYVG